MSDQQQYSPPGMPLPPPNFSTGQPGPTQAPIAFHAPETTPIHITPGQPLQTMPLPQPVIPQTPQQSGSPVASSHVPVQHGPVSTGAAAAEEDESQMDEVWINKAKEIVEKTQYDPFLQSNELSKIKAGYLKSRYNKDIKIAEDRPQ